MLLVNIPYVDVCTLSAYYIIPMYFIPLIILVGFHKLTHSMNLFPILHDAYVLQ